MVSYLLEVGTEELPADFVESSIEQWKTLIPNRLQEQFLTSETLAFYGTPRRLAVVITGLPEKQPDREEEVKGPPASAAFKDGEATKAAQGFAKKQGVAIEDLEIRPTDKGDFVFVKKTIIGRPTAEILQELTAQWIFGLEGKRFMRWGDGDLRFPRPIRWLVTLLDEQVLSVVLENGSETIASGNVSWGHRVLSPRQIPIPTPEQYVKTLEEAQIIVDPEQRKRSIAQQVQTEAKGKGGYAILDEDLLNEVTNLVEFPFVIIGKFDEEFLNLPPEVITTEMISHQRYFPVWTDETAQALLPYFITAANGDPEKADIITRGNERVIRARLADGQFFYNADLSQPLADYIPQLDTVTFQEKLGSVGEKVKRIENYAQWVCEQLARSDSEKQQIQRAAQLCKADLVTQMVGEFPELQGIMGEKYALASGEDRVVASAIAQHYLPKGVNDALPDQIIAQVVAIADRTDTLVSIFGLGMIPSGSSDPFALRRAANGIISIIWGYDLPLNLKTLLQQGVTDFINTFGKSEHTVNLLSQLQDFFLQRIRTLLAEKNIDYDLINAVLGENDPEYTERALTAVLDVQARAEFLQEIRNNQTLDAIYETVNRSTRLAAKGTLDKQTLDPRGLIDPNLFEQNSEKAFYEALIALLPKTEASREQRNYEQLVAGLVEIAPTVSRFFDGEESVLVMAENPAIQQNRLHLLGLLRNHGRILADFGQIVKN
ncbi:glycine--tRNA ligase subunit beta [Dactylococcopsis salina]|uniref:Glycine--tRNA ligase beta subunit n=1 Tax=Dactylococcopsis salina (strain PCC 8305) TaxID=13035 RepID=K9YW52_DACS8|nr:glycine--tRNA ligase subunit beta [Dactylococcopsis salina]AFZ51129.1 glycyl-tRNA synthetase, tetrameric type, beta subunit [Dactylococcopsis salina PCC 8305]